MTETGSLAVYFGRDFHRNAPPGQPEIEGIVKDDVLPGVRNAKRRVSKGEYKKGRHSFDILSAIDPSTVVDASPHVRRLARERDMMLRKWRRPQCGPDDYQGALAVEFSTADLS